jgi:hypothetical protein
LRGVVVPRLRQMPRNQFFATRSSFDDFGFEQG